VFTLGSTAISWVSQLQKIVTISTTEVEYVAVIKASKELIWLQGLLTELGIEQEMNVLHNDSQSAIHLAKNSALPFHLVVNRGWGIEACEDCREQESD